MKEKWSHSVGEKPNTVRAFERQPGGTLYLGCYTNGTFERRSLKHRDKVKAKREARQLLAKLEKGEPADRHVTVADLVRLAGRDSEKLRPRVREHYELRAGLWLNYLGRDFDIRRLTGAHWAAFIADRREGRINAHGLRVSGPSVGERVIEGELRWLRMACRIAVRDKLLQGDPTFGLPIPTNTKPNRPVYTASEFKALLAVAAKLHRYFRPLLILANETGRRFSAIAALKWSDVDLDQNTITWRADSDKLGEDWITPLSPDARRTIEQVRAERPPFDPDAYLFPHPSRPGHPVLRWVATRWLHRAETRAGVKHTQGRAWHGFRRKAATETKHLPAKDAAYYFGWKDIRTMQRAYQKVTMDGLLTVIAERSELTTAVR